MADNGTIESLSLEINARSESAEKAVDKLISTLERLQTKTANLGLGNVGTQLNGIRRAAAGFGDKEAAGLERILGALDRLKNVSTFKISSSIANQLSGIASAAGNINGTDFSGIERLSQALSGLAGVGQVNISSALNQLNRIPKIAENLKSIDLSGFAARIREITDSLRPLAAEMEKVSKGFSAFPDKLQRVLNETEKIPNANKKAANSYALLAGKIGVALVAVRRIAQAIAGMINQSNEYIESQNLFNVAMGQYAAEAREYANTVADALGIDPAEWMKNQGIFMTLATGFGVAGDKAAFMSKNLTQLAYDLSSFYNISTEDAFQKIQSGLAGEIEPMRRLGYDLSNAALQQIAYANGIDKTVSSMTQAEKAQLRYYAMMTRVTQAQGDMARTIDSPANQLRVLRAAVIEAARALGNLFLPIVQAVVPWLIAGANAVTMFANGLASLLNIKGVDDSVNFENIVNGAVDTEDALNGAADAATKFRKTLLGIDELNVLNEKTGTATNIGSGLGAMEGILDSELPDYDFLGQLTETMPGLNFDFSDMDTFARKLQEFANVISDVAVIFGKVKLGGFLKTITGIGEIMDAMRRISSGAGTIDAFLTIIQGITNVASGIALLAGKVKAAGVGIALHGLTTAIKEIAANWDAIKQGDWSGVDKVTMIISALEVLGGVFMAIGAFTKIKGFFTAATTAKKIGTETGKTFTALKTLATNLAWGIVVIGEVVAAVGLLVGGVALLGMGLEQVGTAWEPVIANSETVITAMAVGTSMLVAIGAACYALGSAGKTMVVNIGIGMAVLLEIGAAAALFVAEIWAVGKGLTEIGTAWEPVIENGEHIAVSIGIGTAALVAVGTAAAALGTVSVASAGTIPAAIAIGTAVLVELAIAFVAFTESLVKVADQLSGRLSPALDRANQILPGLATNMGNFVDFMSQFAGQVVRYTGTTVISGLASTVDTVVGWFSDDPIDKLAAEVEKVGDQARKLSEKLTVVIPELQTTILMLTDFHALVEQLNSLMGVDITLSDEMHVNMYEVGVNLISGLSDGMMSMQPILMENLLLISESINTGFILPLQESFTLFFETLNTSFTLNTDLISTSYLTAASTVSTGFIQALTTQFATFFTTQTTLFQALQATITTTFRQSYTSVLSGFITPTRSQMNSLVNQLRSLFNSLRMAIITAFQQAAAGARSAFASLPGWFQSNVYSPIASMLASLRSQISSVIASANAAAAQVASLRVSGYASGGFPSTGEVFIAREAGPELVGRIGNQSAVANNNQIVEGIRQGVYEATVAANAGGRNGDITLYIGGKQVMTVVAEEARRETLRTGVNPLTQGG